MVGAGHVRLSQRGPTGMEIRKWYRVGRNDGTIGEMEL